MTPSQKINVKFVNKPLAKKKTLKEQQEEQRLRKAASSVKPAIVEEKKSVETDINSIAKPVPRKMTIAPSDQSIVNDILKMIDFNRIKGINIDENSITSDLLLSQDIASLEEGAVTVDWESSHAEIISSTGKVHCPQDGSDVAVNLSVTVSKNKTSATRFFTLWVKAQEKVYSDGECVEMVLDALSFDQIKGKNIKVSEITQDLELLTEGLYDTEIFWASKDRSLIDETGKCYQHNLSKNTRVRLYAIITKGNEERLKHFDLTLKTEDF
jgi:aBig family protein